MPSPYPGALRPIISLPAGTNIWIAAGVTDMRRSFTGLSAVAQTVLEQNPYSGHVFVFRGRRGDLIKLLWWDGDGIWPARPREGLNQLSMKLCP
jgi:transposase